MVTLFGPIHLLQPLLQKRQVLSFYSFRQANCLIVKFFLGQICEFVCKANHTIESLPKVLWKYLQLKFRISFLPDQTVKPPSYSPCSNPSQSIFCSLISLCQCLTNKLFKNRQIQWCSLMYYSGYTVLFIGQNKTLGVGGGSYYSGESGCPPPWKL